MTFKPDTLIKRTKGRMVMLYAVTDGNEDHMASFFHEEKVNFVVAALRAKHKNLKFVDEDEKSKSPKKASSKNSAVKPGNRNSSSKEKKTVGNANSRKKSAKRK